MPASRDQFAKALVDARNRTRPRISQRALGRMLPDYGGEEVSGQAVGEWERAKNAPSRSNAVALARIFDNPDLARILGYDVNDVEATVTSELGELRARVDQNDVVIDELRQLTAQLRDLLDRLEPG